ncbi:glycosyltransferase family 4 protein [Paenibacillus pini]
MNIFSQTGFLDVSKCAPIQYNILSEYCRDLMSNDRSTQRADEIAWKGEGMRILLATFWLIPHVGGVWKFMEQIQHRLESMGHEVDLLGNSPDYKKFHIYNRNRELSKEFIRPFLSAKLSKEYSPLLHRDYNISFYEEDRYCMELAAAYFGLDQYDVIHTQDIFSARALGRAKPAHVPLVAHLHGSVATEMKNHFRMNPDMGVDEHSIAWKYYDSIEYYGASSGNTIITANEWQRSELVEYFGIPDPNIHVFQYGLDTESFWKRANMGTSIERPANKKVIIFPARLAFVKGVNVLISALALLKPVRQDWVCWIVGNGEMRKELELQVAGLALEDDVLFLGERDDVPALLTRSDIFVHSCIQDNQPFSVMEAQIAGLPVCVSSAGGLPEMVKQGVTGFVTPVNDPIALFKQLHLLLEDDEYRIEIGKNAAAWGSTHWSLDVMIERLLSVYHSVITEGR